MFEQLRNTVYERLVTSEHPVERDIASLLSRLPAWDQADTFRVQRYHRKIDVAHKVMAAYDAQIDKAVTGLAISSDGYLGLALLFLKAAQYEQCGDENSRSKLLRWVNSACNCLDQIAPAGGVGIPDCVEAELSTLLCQGSPH